MIRTAVALILACGVAAASSVAATDEGLERRVLAEINAARADPASYAEKLKAYRRLYDGKLVRRPGNAVLLQTKEGASAVDEAIAALSRQQPLPALAASPLLARAAEQHAAEQGPSGATGHASPDGAGPGERVRRLGGGSYVAETISYGESTADGVVRQLIIDDGVPSRGHRAILFDGRYRFAGAGCGPHAAYRWMCVIDYSIGRDGGAGS